MAKALEEASDQNWHGAVLRDLEHALVEKPWCEDIYLRGSLARGSEDSESDIDLVVTVAEDEFNAALHELCSAPPLFLRDRLPPWLDFLVRDYGGIGHVYLLQLNEQKWVQIDIYLLPRSLRGRLVGHEPTLFLRTRKENGECGDSMGGSIDLVRRQYEQSAANDIQQAVLSCYIAIFLLRKRLIRRDHLQTFAGTYAAAKCVRDLTVLACQVPEHGWRLDEAVRHSPDPALVFAVLSAFTQWDVVDIRGLSCRVTMLHEMVGLLAPGIWRDNGTALLNLGRFLCSQPPGR